MCISHQQIPILVDHISLKIIPINPVNYKQNSQEVKIMGPSYDRVTVNVFSAVLQIDGYKDDLLVKW